MCPLQLLLGKEVLQAAQLILKVSENLTASPTKTVPLTDACKEESALKAPPFSPVGLGFFGYHPFKPQKNTP